MKKESDVFLCKIISPWNSVIGGEIWDGVSVSMTQDTQKVSQCLVRLRKVSLLIWSGPGEGTESGPGWP